MRITNGDQNTRSNNLGWYLLAEYPLNVMMPDYRIVYERIAGLLFQIFKELGVPPELIRKIVFTLMGFTPKTRMSVKQRRLERLGRTRIFCQKKVIDNADPKNQSRPDQAESMMKPGLIQDPSDTILNGGWGYFIVERSRGSADSSERPCPLFDLYLYKEGE